MELAVNTFNKGLQSDTHPMVQGNDTLSDALNATFVTMNSNEVILQNDMGNRRVDNAYLPSGYEPVGMKEYGGVIYVAAYNPITNRSLIGSFPSPERKISNLDNNKILTINLKLEEVFKDGDLTLDSQMWPLTKDLYLHAGDKFVITGTVESDVSNYNNISGSKVKSSKNNTYTLFAGILNSQNEFVDITNTLARWEGNKIISFKDTDSDLYKFNSGYFIASDFSNPIFEETISDAKLLQERQTIAANTYAYKLVGPMYIKAQLNHIQEFNYNIYGIAQKSDTGDIESATLWVLAEVKYNCPDGITTESECDSLRYISYYEGNSEFIPFLFNESDGYSEVKFNTKYNEETNLYTGTITRKYELPLNNELSLSKEYNYTIKVKANANRPEIFIKGLESSGVINLSLLGSGTLNLIGWRFINSWLGDYENYTGSSTITYTLDAYPKYGTTWSNLTMIFEDIADENAVPIKIPNNPINNGRTTITIDWNKYGFLPRKLYKVTFTYDETSSNSTSGGKKLENKTEFLLTTELLNDCYKVNNEYYIQDFGNPSENKGENSVKSEKEILEEKLKIKFFSQSKLSYTVNKNLGNIEGDFFDIKGAKDEFKISLNITYNINVSILPKIGYNENLYPDYLKLKDLNSSGVMNGSSIVFYSVKKDNIFNKMNLSSSGTQKNISISEIVPEDLTLNEIKFDNSSKILSNEKEFKIIELYKSAAITKTINIINHLQSFKELVDDTNSPFSKIEAPFISIGGKYIGDHGGKSPNMGISSYKYDDITAMKNYDSSKEVEDYYTTGYHAGKNLLNDYSFSDCLSKFTSILNSSDKGNLFIVGISPNEGGRCINRLDTYKDTKNYKEHFPSANHYVLRVWANCGNGTWAILGSYLLSLNKTNLDNIKECIKTTLTNKGWDKLHYTFSSNTSSIKNAKFKDNNNTIYLNPYDINIDIPYKYTFKLSNNFVTNLDKGPIEFTYENEISDENYMEINLNSSEEFDDYIQFILSNNGDLDTFDTTVNKSVDATGNPLLPNTIYYEKDGNLNRMKSYLTFEDKNGYKFPNFLYNTGTDIYPYQTIFDMKELHTRIRLGFTLIPIVSNFLYE